jgi:disulfide bond formation protein DsbB
MLTALTPPIRATALIFGVMTLAILGAWAFQLAGYLPCDLCYMQRWAYYTAVPLSLALVVLQPSWIRYGLVVLLAILIGSAIFGAYHSGVEWGWWAGPSTCGGGGELSGGLPDLDAPLVKCTDAALRIPPVFWGPSLAGWNAIISAVMAGVAFKGLRADPR